MRKFLAGCLAVVMLFSLTAVGRAEELAVESEACLLMEKTTGEVLYAVNEHAKLEPASVTKVMTLLLVMEAIDAGTLHYDDTVTASAHACSMGGSQIWLKENEKMSVEDMLKAVCVASANDCSMALAEHLAGSEAAFVEKMNQRAKELGMHDTTFRNPTGLPAEGHVTSAYDIAVMSRELILNHPDIRRYTTIWMDTLRDGTFGLSNTNKLIRYYEGATGLKTGSTDGAMYCLSATAERDGMELIAVILKSPTSTQRFESAKVLLNYGFAAYALADAAEGVSFSVFGEVSIHKLILDLRVTANEALFNFLVTGNHAFFDFFVTGGDRFGNFLICLYNFRFRHIRIFSSDQIHSQQQYNDPYGSSR